jgi:arylsulfatase A-like enzyme
VVFVPLVLACRAREATAPVPTAGPTVVEPPGVEARLLGDGASLKLRVVTTPLGAPLSWRTSLPSDARLETHLSFARSEAERLGPGPCPARIEVRGADGRGTVLGEREVDPRAGWERFEADLRPWAGQEVELRLLAGCPGAGGPAREDDVRWSAPLVHARRAPGETNLLLITVDTLRPDHLGAYGYSRSTSPNIDALARRGLRFEHAETVQSATWPALTSLHTSLYPSAHGVVWNGHRVDEGLPTLAGVLARHHFSTSAFITNMTRGRHPGFARLFLSRRGGQVEADREAVDHAVAQLAREKDRRFFMWVHLLSPHADYAPPAPHNLFRRPGASKVKGEIEALSDLRRRGVDLGPADVAHVVDLYDGEIAYVDAQVGRLLGALREHGLERNTLVAFSADHGEDLYEHNRYFFHSPSIYGSSMRVPLLLAQPGVLPEGAATDHLASLVDVAPTALHLLGLPPAPEFTGQNLLPGRALPAQPVRQAVFGETGGRIHSVRTREWRLVSNPERFHPDAPGGVYPIGETELYDLRNDPGERHNLAEARPDLVRALSAQIGEWKRLHLRPRGPETKMEPEALEELRALGYLGH